MGNASLIEQLRGEIAAIEGDTHSSILTLKREASEGVAEANGAFQKIVALANVSERSEKALRDRLKKAGYSEQDIDDAIERAKRCGIIDDMRYADILIRSRIAQGKGAAGIERELADNGIVADEVPGWPYNYEIDEETEYQRALEFLEAHPSRSKNKREGAYRKLVQRGYSTSTASSVARTWSERQG